MPHNPAGVTIMWDPAKRLGEVVRAVDDAGHMMKDNVAGFFPILDRKVLDINMTGTVGGYLGIDDIDSRDVVHMDWSGSRRRKSQFRQDGPQVFGMLGGSDCSHKFSFSGAGGSDGLCLTAI